MKRPPQDGLLSVGGWAPHQEPLSANRPGPPVAIVGFRPVLAELTQNGKVKVFELCFYWLVCMVFWAVACLPGSSELFAFACS